MEAEWVASAAKSGIAMKRQVVKLDGKVASWSLSNMIITWRSYPSGASLTDRHPDVLERPLDR